MYASSKELTIKDTPIFGFAPKNQQLRLFYTRLPCVYKKQNLSIYCLIVKKQLSFMKQMPVPKEIQVPFNYESSEVSELIKQLRPLIFQDGNEFICIFGPDMETGVFGHGFSIQDALLDWENKLKERLETASADEVSKEAYKLMGRS